MSTRFTAHFQAEAWQNDNAIPVDPEGEEEWDCTVFLAAKRLTNTVAIASRLDGEWMDRDDVLINDPAAPEWIRQWHGPFTINVRLIVALEIEDLVCPVCRNPVCGEAPVGGGAEWSHTDGTPLCADSDPVDATPPEGHGNAG